MIKMLPNIITKGDMMKEGIIYQNELNGIDEFDKFNEKLSYNELCDCFNLQKLRGGYIKRQIELIEKDYELEKDGKYYIITKKLTTQEKLNIQYHNKLKSHIEILMCTLFAIPKEDFVVSFNMKQLLQLLQLVNKDFHDTKRKNNIKIARELLCIDSNLIELEEGKTKDSLEIFMEETEPMLSRIVKEVMKGLENKKIIGKKEMPILARRVYKKGKLTYTETKEINTESLEKQFLEAQYKALNILKDNGAILKAEETYVNKQGSYIINKYRELTAMQMRYEYWYPQYILTLNKEYLSRFERFVIRDIKEKCKVNELCNKIVKNKILTSKQGNLKFIEYDDRVKYVDVLIDTNVDFGLRDVYKEREKEDK